MKATTIILFVFIILGQESLLSQNNIVGKVVNSETEEPIQFATVYINGTTKGTSTDEQGNFDLPDIISPCQLIIDMVGYETGSINIDTFIDEPLYIKIEFKDVELKTVKTLGENKRKGNVNIFNRYFLGADEWGLKAKLINDEVLFFKPRSEKIISKSGRHYERRIALEVESESPIKVQLPNLGYDLKITLEDFNVRYGSFNPDTISYLAYYYFIPQNINKKKKQNKISKNRQRAYYNSNIHFCRSLYTKTLKENGYDVFQELVDEKTKKTEVIPFNIYDFMRYTEDGLMILENVNDKKIHILYYSDRKGKPKNISLKKPKKQPLQSGFFFFNQKSIISPEGLIISNDLFFNGEIAKKKVGAILPLDYFPPLEE